MQVFPHNQILFLAFVSGLFCCLAGPAVETRTRFQKVTETLSPCVMLCNRHVFVFLLQTGTKVLLLKSAFWRRTAIVFAAEKPLRISASYTRRGKKSPVFKCANNSFKRTQLVCNRELLRPKAAEMKRNLKWNQKREFISAPHHPTPTPSSFTHSHTHSPLYTNR